MADTLYPDLKPWELEPHYSHHVGAMTSEGLHEKADIAFQLALRDKEIDLLRAQLLVATRQPEPVSTQALAVPVYECANGTCGLCWLCSKQGNEPQGAPPEGEYHTCCGNKLSFGQRCPDCRTIRDREC